MKKTIFLFFAAILCASSVWAWNVEQGKVFYFKPSSVWKSDGARFAVAFGSGDNTYAWESCVAVSGETDVYYVVSPGNYDWMIFCRMKPSTSNDWANKWNESQRVQPNNNYNKFDLKANWDTDFNWYKYAPPMQSASITNTSTVYGGDGTQGNPYQIEKGKSISVSATATSTVPADNQTKYYKFYKKENSGSRTNINDASTTSTCSFTSSSTVGTKYEIDVEAQNEYYGTYGTTATSSKLYFVTIEPIYAILGSFNKWTHSANTWDLTDKGSNNWEASFHLDKGEHTFKVVHNSSYYGKNSTTITRASAAVSDLSTESQDINLITDFAGNYTFTFNSSTKKLTIKYPFPDLSNQPNIIYFQPSNKWKEANARFAAFFMYGDAGTEDKWENLTDEDKDGIYQVNNEKKHIGIIFVRMNPDHTENKWDNKWDQTEDLYIPMDGNNWFKMTATGEDWGYAGVWAYYQKVTVTATANPAEGGTVSGGGTYLYNNEVTLTATANTGYDFVNWTKDGEQVSDNPTYEFTATENVDLVANFKLKTFTVQFLDYDGTELQSSSVNYGETPAYNGTTPVREADAQYTYTFSGWDPEIAAVTSDQTYTAQYSTTVNQYIVTATAAEGGTVTGAGTYDYGTSVTLTATANTGYEFVNWTEDGVEVSADAELTLTVKKNVTLTANFAALEPETYTRTVTVGNFGTICLPFGSNNYTGAEFYELVGQETGKVYIGSVTTLEAGVPYIFRATGTELAVYSDGTNAATPGNKNGLHGTFTDDTEVAVGNYILYNNAICECNATCWVNANRAYIVWNEIPEGAPQKMPGRKYIGMGVQGENEETAIEDILSAEAPAKVIENGQLIIIRNGVKYNVQGQIVE